MTKIDSGVKFFINLGKTQTILANRFDKGLGGLGFNEFLILFHLEQADKQQMRRVDLAEKIGMTASGVTRLLLPMEKVHLLKSGPIADDARARFVTATPAGKQKFTEALERLEFLAEDIIPAGKIKELNVLSDLLVEVGGKALMM